MSTKNETLNESDEYSDLESQQEQKCKQEKMNSKTEDDFVPIEDDLKTQKSSNTGFEDSEAYFKHYFKPESFTTNVHNLAIVENKLLFSIVFLETRDNREF